MLNEQHKTLLHRAYWLIQANEHRYVCHAVQYSALQSNGDLDVASIELQCILMAQLDFENSLEQYVLRYTNGLNYGFMRTLRMEWISWMLSYPELAECTHKRWLRPRMRQLRREQRVAALKAFFINLWKRI